MQPLTQGVPLDVPEKGRPVAQRYGLEGGWAGGRFDLRKIVGEKSARRANPPSPSPLGY